MKKPFSESDRRAMLAAITTQGDFSKRLLIVLAAREAGLSFADVMTWLRREDGEAAESLPLWRMVFNMPVGLMLYFFALSDGWKEPEEREGGAVQ